MNRREKVIDLRGILAECLFKWRIILLIAILGGICGLVVTRYKNAQYVAAVAEQERLAAEAVQASNDEKATVEESYDEQMAEAKAVLTQLQISKVDGLYAQYAANIQLRDSLSYNINNSVIMQMDADHASITRLMYTLDTDQDYLASSINTLVMTDELFDHVAPILGENVEPKYMADLLSVWKGSTGTTGDSIHVYDDERSNSIIYLQAIAFTKDQANQIAEIMADALESAVEDMRDIDPDIALARIGEASTIATSSTINDIQRTLVNEMNTVANQIATIEVNEIPKLNEDETTYYELLVSEGKGIHVDESEEIEDIEPVVTDTVTISPPSRARFIAAGIIGGAMASAAVIALYWVLFGRRARSIAELEFATNIPILAVFERRLSLIKDPIKRYGIHIQTGDKAVEDEEAYRPILAARVKELLQQNGKTCLYLLGEGEQALTDGMNIAVTSGIPESSEQAMQEFLQADSAILITRMYRTETAAIANAIDLCRIHGKQILGNIVIYGPEK